MPLTCPICKGSLSLSEHIFSCENGHCYDQAKEGYVNLMALNKKHSKNPGDSLEMVQQRRSFLETGAYDPLVEKMKEMILELGPQGITMLDSCSGDGYYTNLIASDEELEIDTCYGFDISKAAVKYASKKYKKLGFFVATVHDIPLEADSIDMIMTVFSPLDASEFSRVLMDEGYLLVVSAGPDHLKELALMVYDTFKEHSHNPSAQLGNKFAIEETKGLRYELTLENPYQIMSLLKMTPYYWNLVPEKLEKIKSLDSLKVTCDFNLSLFVKVGGDEEEE